MRNLIILKGNRISLYPFLHVFSRCRREFFSCLEEKQDENGNLIQHGHEHTHQHTHADGVSHTHAHTHDGTEGHDHTHNEGQNCSTDCGGCQGGDCRNETVALLTYMLQHNEHHAAELDQMADNLAKMGMDAAAKTIKESVSDFQKGNMRLGLALTLVKEEMK